MTRPLSTAICIHAKLIHRKKCETRMSKSARKSVATEKVKDLVFRPFEFPNAQHSDSPFAWMAMVGRGLDLLISD
jgi:hypothetical protein